MASTASATPELSPMASSFRQPAALSTAPPRRQASEKARPSNNARWFRGERPAEQVAGWAGPGWGGEPDVQSDRPVPQKTRGAGVTDEASISSWKVYAP